MQIVRLLSEKTRRSWQLGTLEIQELRNDVQSIYRQEIRSEEDSEISGNEGVMGSVECRRIATLSAAFLYVLAWFAYC